MRDPSRRAGRWWAAALVELVAVGVVCALTRCAPLIDDEELDQPSAEDERRAGAERQRQRTHHRRPHHPDPIERVAQ